MVLALSRGTWIRCIIVSAVLALLAPLISSVSLVPSEGEQVIELGATEAQQLKDASAEEFLRQLERAPTRTVNGFERFTYQFTHPQYWIFYFRGVGTSFVWLLLATLSVSYWGLRRSK